jgi:HEAT repeat protein
LLKDRDARVRARAAHSLGTMGPAARAAVPALLANMTDRDVKAQQAAFQALLRIGSEDADQLGKAFAKLNQEEAWAAPIPLPQFGPELRDAVRPLMRDLQHADEGKRLSAALALGTIGVQAREAVPELQKAIQDASPLVRQSAAVSLALISRESKGDREFEPTVKQIQQRLAMLLRELPEMKKGPVKREALTDPKVQRAYNQVVDLHILVSVQLNQVGKSNPWLAKQLGLSQLRLHVGQALTNQFGPDAIPALVRGMHLAAYYDLGFC